MSAEETLATLLVVDDQPGVRCLLTEVFTVEGYRVLLAANGNDALEIAAETVPDLVLLDLKMPGISGLETLDGLMEIDDRIPVVIMTAVNDADAERAVARGALCSLAKPFDVHELSQLVASILGQDKLKVAEDKQEYNDQ